MQVVAEILTFDKISIHTSILAYTQLQQGSLWLEKYYLFEKIWSLCLKKTVTYVSEKLVKMAYSYANDVKDLSS